MSDPLTNPYAPPAAPSAVDASPRRSRSNYENERRNVPLLAVFCVITFGVYPSLWYLRRARFLDLLAPPRKVGPLPWVSLALILALVVLSGTRATQDAANLVRVGASVVSLVLGFRVAAILRGDFARSLRGIHISAAGVFFFGCLYLQHVMNEAADVPARGSE